jgi:hypothetical protein
MVERGRPARPPLVTSRSAGPGLPGLRLGRIRASMCRRPYWERELGREGPWRK